MRRPARARVLEPLRAWAAPALLLIPAAGFATGLLMGWISTPRFGAYGAFLHGLEYGLLPASLATVRWYAALAVAGILVQQAALALRGWRTAAAAGAGWVALVAYAGVLYATEGPDRDDLLYESPDLVWAPSSIGTGVLAAGAAAALGWAAWLYFARSGHRALLAPGRWRALAAALALGWAAALVVALALPHLVPDGAPERNVLLVSMDTLRADHLGVYGYGRETSPTIDALGEGGTVFENAVTQAPWTLPAHMSLFTGLYPLEHGLTEYTEDRDVWRAVSPEIPILAEVLAGSGYLTAAFTGGGFLGPDFGFARGFDLYRTESRQLEDFAPAVVRWIGRNRHRPFFLFLHSYDVHQPYAPPAEHASRFAPPGQSPAPEEVRNFCRAAEESGRPPAPEVVERAVALYDGEIRYSDELLGRVIAALDETGVRERTLIVVLSDHGDEFFEHGNCDHIKSLYDPLVRVPLILSGPGIPGSRFGGPVELREVPGMVLDYLGLENRLLRGFRPVLGALSEPARLPPRAGYSETCCAAYELRDGQWRFDPRVRTLRALRTGTHKLITDADGSPLELYDLVADPGEQRNLLAAREVSGEARRVAARLEGELRERLEEMAARALELAPGEGSAPAVDEETLRQLEALGYLD